MSPVPVAQPIPIAPSAPQTTRAKSRPFIGTSRVGEVVPHARGPESLVFWDNPPLHACNATTQLNDSSSNDVVDFDDLGLAGVDPDGLQDGHENAPKGLEVLLRIEQIGHPERRTVAVASMMKPSARRPISGRFE